MVDGHYIVSLLGCANLIELVRKKKFFFFWSWEINYF